MSNGIGTKPPFKVYPAIWDPVKSPVPTPLVPPHEPSPGALVVTQTANPGSKPDETDPNKIAAANDVAKNLLSQKNRKRKHGPRMELPFDPTMEEGSMWALSGFAPNFDGNWLVHEVVFTFTGKGGSRLEIDLMQPPDTKAAPAGVNTVSKKRALTSNSNVGADANPVPLNLGFGGQSTSWLPAGKNVALASRT